MFRFISVQEVSALAVCTCRKDFSTFLVVCGITDFFSNDQMLNYAFTLLPN